MFMYRLPLAFAFSLSLATAVGQIKNLYPTSTGKLEFSEAGELAFNTLTPNGSFDNLGVITSPEIDTLANGETDTIYNETIVQNYERYFDVLMPGCSWYCGGKVDTVKSSSSLQQQGKFTYHAKNAADFSYETAWVEGAKGAGIGEYIEYQFSPESARVEEVKIANGYVKSEKAWKENARVKKLKLYHNGKPYAILNLKDERSEQVFRVGPFGFQYYLIDDDKKPTKRWTLRFEILEVYPGTRYSDTAISEIHFMAYDEH
jgi:hypothetical protein